MYVIFIKKWPTRNLISVQGNIFRLISTKGGIYKDAIKRMAKLGNPDCDDLSSVEICSIVM